MAAQLRAGAPHCTSPRSGAGLAISWGHATSADLLTWEHQPPVLVPGDGDDGCWSGSVCVVPPDAPAAMYYTSVRASDPDHGEVRLATPADDDWSTWRKGPVIVSTAGEPHRQALRDPNVFWDR